MTYDTRKFRGLTYCRNFYDIEISEIAGLRDFENLPISSLSHPPSIKPELKN